MLSSKVARLVYVLLPSRQLEFRLHMAFMQNYNDDHQVSNLAVPEFINRWSNLQLRPQSRGLNRLTRLRYQAEGEGGAYKDRRVWSTPTKDNCLSLAILSFGWDPRAKVAGVMGKQCFAENTRLFTDLDTRISSKPTFNLVAVSGTSPNDTNCLCIDNSHRSLGVQCLASLSQASHIVARRFPVWVSRIITHQPPCAGPLGSTQATSLILGSIGIEDEFILG
ncbi:hypothetical protein VNO77_03457 [Canavalia gladiata]|uniref:Uncharacterized protein n=1 Tax=Canavalia gladiata TaxID=3824 RepID=A0AAN9R3X1_CANGL